MKFMKYLNRLSLLKGAVFSTAIDAGPASTCKEIHEQNR